LSIWGIRGKAACENSVNFRFLSMAQAFVTLHMMNIINLSFSENTFPTCWKHAKIKPLYKSADHKVVSNYRPISILPNLSKFVEIIANRQIIRYIESNKLLYSHQFGFRPKMNTAAAVVDLLDDIYFAIDKNLVVAVVFLDFSKAFDTVPHGRLLRKLACHFNFSDASVDWIGSFLTNRLCHTEVDNFASRKSHNRRGIPQGSILSPILFNTYINDIHHHINFSKVVCYADNTTLICSSSSIGSLVDCLNEDLASLSNYCKINKLKAT